GRHVRDAQVRAVRAAQRNAFEGAQDAAGIVVALRRPGTGAEPTDAADDVLGVALVDDVAADGAVRAGDGLAHVPDRKAKGPQAVRVQVDLIFAGGTADTSDLGHAGHGVELGGDVPVLHRPQPAQVGAGAFEGVPEDLPGGRGVRGQVRHDADR